MHASSRVISQSIPRRFFATGRCPPTPSDKLSRSPLSPSHSKIRSVRYVTENSSIPCRWSDSGYLGAPNIEDYAPGNHCYINVRDYANPCALAAYLKAVLAKPGAYEEYLEWKRQPLRPAFLSFLDSQRSHPLVRLCEAVRAVRNG